MRAYYLHIKSRIANGISYLLPGSSCCKHSEGICKWLIAAGCKSCCHTLHICLRNSHIEKAIRICFFKALCHRRSRKVGVEYYEFRIFFSQCHNGLAVCCSCSYFFSHIISPPIPQCAHQALFQPAHTARHSEPCRAIRPDSPCKIHPCPLWSWQE